MDFAEDAEDKTDRYRPPENFQRFLERFNEVLTPLERSLTEERPAPADRPLLFITYVPRSGSTLVSQLLARCGYNYVSNFQARFWRAPYVGGLLERNLGLRKATDVGLRSDYGLTPGSSEPSEFSYFWSSFFQFEPERPHTLTDAELARVDRTALAREVNAIRSLSERCTFFKKEWLGMNAGFLGELFEEARFLHVVRDPFYVAQSILQARERVYGGREHWWAARPSSYEALRHDSPYAQVAGQVAGILADIGKWQRAMPNRFLTVTYDEATQNPQDLVEKIGQFAGTDSKDVDLDVLPRSLDRRERVTIDRDDLKGLEAALADIRAETPCPDE